MRRPILAVPVVLAACAAAAPPAPDYALDAGGIQIAGSALRIDFGRTEPGVVAAVTRLEGREPDLAQDVACPGGTTRAVTWPDGPTLLFRDAAFVGWSADGRSAGIACA